MLKVRVPCWPQSLAEEEPGVIVVDGVYGNGAVARVAEAADVAEATGSVLVVDETHSFGCAAGGLGVCEEAGVSHRVHFRTVSFYIENRYDII